MVPLCARSFQTLVADVVVVGVDLVAGDFLHFQMHRGEERNHAGFDILAVGAAGRFGDIVFVGLQPLRQIILHHHIGDAVPLPVGVGQTLHQVEVARVVLFENLIQPVRGFGFAAFLRGQIKTAPFFVTLAVGVVEVDDRVPLAIAFTEMSGYSFPYFYAPFFS